MRYLNWPLLALNLFMMFCILGSAALSEVRTGLARVDARNSSIEDVLWGQVHLQLSLSQGVPYRVYTTTEPNRVVLEFNKAIIDGLEVDEINQSDRIGSVEVMVSKAGWHQFILHIKQPLIVYSVEIKVPDDGSNALLELVWRR